MTSWPMDPARDQTASEPLYRLSSHVKQALERLLVKYKIPGLCISVVRQKEGAWESGVTALGIRDSSGSPWLPDSQHAIASCSKVFAAASVGILIARDTRLPNGETLTWTTKIKTVLPDWTMMDKEVEENTDIEDALAMRLGIPVNNVAWGFTNDTPSAIVNRMRYHRPASSFRRTAIYSNSSLILAGEFISKLSGMPYHEFVERNIFDPLGMKDSQFEHKVALASGKRVEGFAHYGQTGPGHVGEVGGTAFWNEGDGLFLAAAGGAWSTGNDILLWLKETLTPRILSPAVLDELNRPRTAWGAAQPPHPTMSQMFYGIGQHTHFYRGHRVVGHTGSLPGHYSFVFRLPDDDIALALFCNDATFGPDMLDTALQILLDDLLDIPERVDWEDIFFTPGLQDAPLPRQSPTNPRPSGGITGTYTEGAYGELKVVRIEDHPMGAHILELLKTYPGSTIPVREGAHIYLGDLAHDLRGSLLLSPVDGPIFTRAWIKAKPVQRIGGGRSYAAQLTGVGRCVVTQDGIGMFEDFWGQGGAVGGMIVRQCVEEDVERQAEVWFSRTQAIV